MSCKHKFRTNIDGIILATSQTEGIHNKAALTPYVTIIFCEKCGVVAHNANVSRAENEMLRKKLVATQSKEGE